jgi:hypothetical protein
MPTSAQNLAFAIRAVNESQKALADVQADIRETGGLTEEQSGRMRKAWGGIGGAIKDVGKIAGGFLAAQAIIAAPKAISATIDRAKDLELQAGKAATVFGDSLPIVQDWAKESAGAMGVSRREATNLATSMADLLIPMGFTRDEAAKMSTETLGLAGALAEWSGGQRTAAEVSEILAKAYLGETESLKGLGVSLSQAEISARLLEKGQADLTGEALAQAKALAIQELILEKSTDAQTKFAEGSNTAARRQAEMQAAMADAKDELALALAPALTSLQELLARVVIPALVALTTWMTEVLAPQVRRWIDEYGPMIEQFWNEQVKPALDDFLATVAAIVDFFVEHWPEIEAVVRPVLDEVINRVQLVIDQLVNVIQFITAVFKGDWDRAWAEIKDLFFTQWDSIKESIANLVKFLEGVWPLVRAAALTLGEKLIAGFKQGFAAAWASVTEQIENFPELVKGIWLDTFRASRQVGESVLDGLRQGVSGLLNIGGDVAAAVLTAVRNVINSEVIDRFNRAVEISFSIGAFGKSVTVDINPPDIPHLAAGTRSFEGGLALVGEQGPELALLPPFTAVMNAHDTRRTLAGAGTSRDVHVTVHMPNYLGDKRQVARAIAQELRMVVA